MEKDLNDAKSCRGDPHAAFTKFENKIIFKMLNDPAVGIHTAGFMKLNATTDLENSESSH
ncbi:MAG: hypothetical protein ACRDAQ_06310 [Cetobacterium sp.]